ncbi:MAG TPA: SDR family NAD(P)-dependent oxidoreductase, partial [Bacteroidales bacterium]|nr:SDR family NAD(P)-dependent oxidoreductase [Bacteroidales bacterium]
MELLQNKVVLITGGARGIGRSIAIAVAKQGAQVAFSDLRADENYNRLLSELRSLGVKAEAFESNAASFTDAEKLINDVYAAFGRIDVLVNNAGITRDNLLMRMTEEQWDMVINVNLKS